jgi:hypothetical protein
VLPCHWRSLHSHMHPHLRNTSFNVVGGGPEQSEYIFRDPLRPGNKVLSPSKMRCTAISHRSSPLYALAEAEKSMKEPRSLPDPAEQSKKKAVEQRFVWIEGMYEPSAITIQVLFAIAARIQSVSPCHWRSLHSHMHPHLWNTSFNVVGGGCS